MLDKVQWPCHIGNTGVFNVSKSNSERKFLHKHWMDSTRGSLTSLKSWSISEKSSGIFSDVVLLDEFLDFLPYFQNKYPKRYTKIRGDSPVQHNRDAR